MCIIVQLIRYWDTVSEPWVTGTLEGAVGRDRLRFSETVLFYVWRRNKVRDDKGRTMFIDVVQIWLSLCTAL